MAREPEQQQPDGESPVVYIVDDEPLWCRALVRLLRAAGLRAQAFTGAGDFLDACDAAAPGCVLLDLNMPGIDGLAVQEAMRRRGLSLPVIFVSGDGSLPRAVSAMRAGAIDFIEKPFDNDRVLERVRAAIELDRDRRQRGRQREAAARRIQRLTPRERQVLDLLVQGLSNKEIAQVLGASNRTIDVHRAHLMTKMEAGSLPELVRVVLTAAAPP